MSTLTPESIQIQRRKDVEQIKILSVFHFVFAGLALLGIALFGLHYFMMHSFFANPDFWKNQKGATPPPAAFFNVFVWFYVFAGVLLLAALIANVLSGLFLLQRKHRLFSMIIAGLNCLQIPFGTALGVFTIIVLSRESVHSLYSGAA